jgi:myo-inositol-1(or 4)-monophosphatase
MVSLRLSSAFPDISFMGEETYKPGMRVGPEPTFVCDPIDGMDALNPYHQDGEC